ncbi:RNase HII [Ferrithrix thermotolerans DSM 19514]|uniref:Ribonuclease n=1 Tax=Ferrithrix thermotolerans DSM 19514 TaxID=1121881 RepID=A0A1M4WW57_9ACTN|nr:RNase HII [Ferrithrix thermotolerans DSM 19514]
MGRGAWAGPLVVGAVLADPTSLAELLRLKRSARQNRETSAIFYDSKALSRKKREVLANDIRDRSLKVGLGVVSAEEISSLGLSACLTLGFLRACSEMGIQDEEIHLDGNFNYLKGTEYEEQVVCKVKGDTLDPLIAGASIVAKVFRDAVMAEASVHYPYYGFEDNVGYPSKTHIYGLQGWGMCPEHRDRWSFATKLPFGPLSVKRSEV